MTVHLSDELACRQGRKPTASVEKSGINAVTCSRCIRNWNEFWTRVEVRYGTLVR